MRAQRHAPAAAGKGTVPIVQEAVWAPGPVWKGAENLAFTGIRSPNRPARSQSLYRLRYPAHNEEEKHSRNILTLLLTFLQKHKVTGNIGLLSAFNINIYIYIYIYTHTHTHIYTYIQ